MGVVSLRCLSLPFKVLNAVQAISLEAPFVQDEVKLAVWRLGEDKAPGPDGFLIIFFKHFWELVKPEVLAFVFEFFERGIISKDLGATFLTLIPKNLNDFRPISLLGSPYKI